MPRNTAQQLYDVGYVVYGGEREAGGKEGRREGRREGGKEGGEGKGRRMSKKKKKGDAKERKGKDKEVEN